VRNVIPIVIPLRMHSILIKKHLKIMKNRVNEICQEVCNLSLLKKRKKENIGDILNFFNTNFEF